LSIIILVGIAFVFDRPVPARADTQLGSPSVEWVFGQQVIFYATLQTDVDVVEARFYFQRPEDRNEIAVQALLDGQGTLSYTYDLMAFPLQAFSSVDYRFEVTVVGGEVFSSSPKVFSYVDNRFVWHDSPPGTIMVHWYEGDEAFGQELLDVAHKGTQQAQKWLKLYNPQAINIYVYASAQEMRSTLMLAGTDWVAGHADPVLGLIRISIPPGPEQRTEMERQIPHELMHILLYQTLDPGYNKLPAWLNEGLASATEIYPNPYYHTILSQALEKDSLLSFTDICQNFPVDASGAYLAYAQAASFTRYLYEQYGADGLENLVMLYAKDSGMDCQNGTEKALGVPLSQLESSWRQWIQGGSTPPAESNSAWPWVTVLGIVLAVPLVILIVNANRRSRRAQSSSNSRRPA
jgi:hypothetical protein